MIVGKDEYNSGMPIKRTSHAVYDTSYHLVWAPKYRKWIIRGDRQDFVKERFEKIVEVHDFEIEAMEIPEDHVYIFLGFTPSYSIAEIVQRFKEKSARETFQGLPRGKAGIAV